MNTCTRFRKPTLSNAIQGIYRAEVARQHSASLAANLYKCEHQQILPRFNLPLSKRSFSTSQVYADKQSDPSDRTTTSKAQDIDLLTELTSTTKARNTPRDLKTSKATKSSKNPLDKKAAGQKKSPDKEKKAAAEPTLPPPHLQKKQKLESWQIQKEALKEKFQEGWHPRKKLPPDTLDTIRHLHATKPKDWTTPVLAEQFKVSPEAIRRILKSKWQPSDEERQKRQDRWEKRYEKIWSHMEELGLRPKKGEQTAKLSDARRLGIESPPSSSP